MLIRPNSSVLLAAVFSMWVIWLSSRSDLASRRSSSICHSESLLVRERISAPFLDTYFASRCLSDSVASCVLSCLSCSSCDRGTRHSQISTLFFSINFYWVRNLEHFSRHTGDAFTVSGGFGEQLQGLSVYTNLIFRISNSEPDYTSTVRFSGPPLFPLL